MTALLPLLLPALASGLAMLLRGRTGWAVRGSVAGLGLTALAAGMAATRGAAVSWSWGSGLRLSLEATGFGAVMAVLVPVVASAVVMYVDSGEELPETDVARLVASMCAFVAAMELLVLAGDLLTLLIGWELVGALSWVLIGFHWRDRERPRSAAIAFLTTRFGDIGLYLAAAAAFASVGSLHFDALSDATGPYLHVILGGILLAAAAKSAQLPFSPWLYAAMAGPTPVSALLHSATLVAAGVYLLIRLGPLGMSVAWFGPAVAGIGVVTLLVGGLGALVQTDLKRALAASTVSQYGLMFVAAGAGSTAVASAHLVSHALFKSLLFLGAGVAIHAAGTRELAKMSLGRMLPLTAAAFGVGALALGAVPPLGGAVTKEWIVTAALETSPWLGSAVLLSGLLTAAYASRLAALAFGPGPARDVRRPGSGEVAGLTVLSAFSVGLGGLLFPGGRRLAETLLHYEPETGAAWELFASLLMIGLAVTAVVQLRRRGSLVTMALAPGAQRLIGNWFGLASARDVVVVRPVMAVARALAMLDDRVVDAGVRAAAAVGARLSRGLALFAERGVDGVITAVTEGTLGFAAGSRTVDDRGIDGAVEGLATLTRHGGATSRRLQSGMAHHYYVLAGVGLLVMLGVSIFWG